MPDLNSNNQIDRCAACQNPRGYCATYVGPLFQESGRKIVFIGLDAGDSSNPEENPAEVQVRRVTYYRVNGTEWNWHYKATVAMVADLLGLSGCAGQCQQRCARLQDSGCALLQFAQGNAVKCVKDEHPSRQFDQQDMIPHCLPQMFEELSRIQPEVIVLQGQSMEDEFYDLMRANGTHTSERLSKQEQTYAGIMTWRSTGSKSIVVTMHAPRTFMYHGNWAEFMNAHVQPRLATIHAWFERNPDIKPFTQGAK